jgi:hypothetical protein
MALLILKVGTYSDEEKIGIAYMDMAADPDLGRP